MILSYIILIIGIFISIISITSPVWFRKKIIQAKSSSILVRIFLLTLSVYGIVQLFIIGMIFIYMLNIEL
ncbi:hypothetical protein A2773_03720 [Candidatus Gottesmanbacteria bacterium RIFCSPHIGHO2_01_FULL_39_10]|uniref:Uncharacterized protein n=1 Tax=Candidatus Gottesmanbacteria bacterium RIFCSPHIGHO2_01_FULL_39_10 TaxID=1798375 RepID=A0A1F5ZR53_9BACT|nr:MAG: hypothetical protein A2773_03720 [Candidatus Gottesmanbacteria bacterium RIFCSPHIGHO2_01_FULL_39_10]